MLRAASMWARPGCVTALLGRNGSGKSTLLRIGAGWLAADHGVVRFRSQLFQRPRLHRMSPAGLMYLRQDSPFSPNLKVGEQLRAVARRFGSETWTETIEELRLGECLDRWPRSLSGGEKKRASLALALLRRPSCLLIDEPFTGITPLDQELISRLLGRLAESGTAIITTGHDVPVLFQAAHEILWVTAGTTHHLGTPEQAHRHSQFQREYLGAGTRTDL